MATVNWMITECAALDWNRSFSEPDLSGPHKHQNRFTIKHPHEYIAVDDLKYFRRRQPTDFHTRSSICLYNSDEPVLPFGSLKTEYRKHFRALDLACRPSLLRRATSLRLEGSMHLQSEHQEQYHWFTPDDWKFSRTFPVRNPESFQLNDNRIKMNENCPSSFISYPMVDRSMQILPREMFRNEVKNTAPAPDKSTSQRVPAKEIVNEAPAAFTTAAANKLVEDKLKRDLAAEELHKCHLQQRALASEQSPPAPSEYKRQFVQFPIEKAHSIPQMSSMKLQGEFVAVPEYQDSFKMYASYSKSAPIKKIDNLRISGAEVQAIPVNSTEVPEYRDKFNDPPKNVPKEKSLKTDDHLHPRGEFTKDVPEYYESFRDPQIKEMPERGKCREPYLRLKGKIEFNPEYRNTYLDFPRSRPIVRKPASSFRLPISNTTTTTTTTSTADNVRSPKSTPRRAHKSSSPLRQHFNPESNVIDGTDIIQSPEYRRAQYNYQLRERTPPRKVIESDGGGNSKLRKSSDSSLEALGRQQTTNKRRPSRHRQASQCSVQPTSFEDVGSNLAKKPGPRFGRRASILQNAENCREKSSIVEGNPKYAVGSRRPKHNNENQDSFVVLDEPVRSNWMKKTWYDS